MEAKIQMLDVGGVCFGQNDAFYRLEIHKSIVVCWIQTGDLWVARVSGWTTLSREVCDIYQNAFDLQIARFPSFIQCLWPVIFITLDL